MDETTYLFFSHVHKGQAMNMPMLKTLVEKKATLIDYERIVDLNGRRLVFFGRYAGLAGAVETLHSLGQRLKKEGYKTPLEKIKRPTGYRSLDEALGHISEVGLAIQRDGLPMKLVPLVIGITGYGNVSRGAQEVFEALKAKRVDPFLVEGLFKRGADGKTVYISVFREEHTVQPASAAGAFELNDYYRNPGKYKPIFESFAPFLTALCNCIYWEPKYPRLLTKKYLKEYYKKDDPRLRVIGDISADLNGSVECTSLYTTPEEPCYVWDTEKDGIDINLGGKGPIIMAVDNLPCEFPIESSEEFSKSLLPFVKKVATADYSDSFDNLSLPPEIKGAVIAHAGALASSYQYLMESIKKHG